MRKLSQIEADWKAATPGPWEADGYAVFLPETPEYDGLCSTGRIEDAKAIANAPTDIRDFLDWVKRMVEFTVNSLGPKCEEYEPDCVVCQAHKLLDEVKE
jgi:hypothetical protein